MLARLIAYTSGKSPDGMLTWHFDVQVEVIETGKPLFNERISLEAVTLIASADKQGPLYQLCRAIRDAGKGATRRPSGLISRPNSVAHKKTGPKAGWGIT